MLLKSRPEPHSDDFEQELLGEPEDDSDIQNWDCMS
jgi:hypothetical protein